MNSELWRAFGILLWSAYSVYFVWHYGGAGLDGIRKRKMRFRGLTSTNFYKFYELEGDGALVCGIFFMLLVVLCTTWWIVPYLQQIVPK